MKQKVFHVVDPNCRSYFKATTYMLTPDRYRPLLPLAVYKDGEMILVHEPKFTLCPHCGSLVLTDAHYGTLLEEVFEQL